MNNSTFRKPLLRRNFSIECLGRKSSINALAPMGIAQDKDGFESVDSYFPEDTENVSNSKLSRTWKVEDEDVDVRFDDGLIDMPDDGEHRGYDDGVGVEPISDAIGDLMDDEDGEIVLKKTIKARVSLSPTVSPLSPTVSPTVSPVSQRPRAKAKATLTRKRSLLPDPLVAVDGDTDDMGRRSHRKRFAPLAFWKNEKVVYGRRNSASTPSTSSSNTRVGMPVIVDVAKPAAAPERKKRRQKRKRPTAAQPEKLPKLDTLGVVRDYESKQDVEAQLALSNNLVKGEAVPGADFQIHTVFVEGDFMSSGVLQFPVGSEKPSRNSSRHSLVPADYRPHRTRRFSG